MLADQEKTIEEKDFQLKGFDYLAIISTLGCIGWVISDFYGGMMLFLIAYSIVIIPILIAYAVSFIETVVSFSRNGFRPNRIKVFFHLLFFVFILICFLMNSELFKSERVLSARMMDDLFSYELVLRKNYDCEVNIQGFLGYTESLYGRYCIEQDTIILNENPYDSFLPDSILIDTTRNAIFINRNKDGTFSTNKIFLNYFEIGMNKLEKLFHD